MNEPSESTYWLSLVPKDRIIRISIIEQVYHKYTSIEPLWREEPDFLRKLGLTETELRKFLYFRSSFKPEYFQSVEEALTKQKIDIVKYVDPEYPQVLKDFGEYNIPPPLLLFVKGSLEKLGEGVAIVGTRDCSFYGRMMARKMAKTVAKAGYFVASGLARGVDTEAHSGALEAPKGRTVAVLPWLERIYPEENTKLAQDITKNGAVISEYFRPPYEQSSKWARAGFVLRNRITSGLSRCVILIESGESEGTYRQAIIAQKQGRKIFALKPRRENTEALEGFNKFIEMGATSIESAKPVLNYLKRYKSTTLKEKRIDSFYQHRIEK